MVGYTSTEAHSCIARTFDYMGLGQDALRQIPVDGHYRMNIAALKQAIAEDIEAGNRPFCVVGAAATVNTAAIDDLDAIEAAASFANEYGRSRIVVDVDPMSML